MNSLGLKWNVTFKINKEIEKSLICFKLLLFLNLSPKCRLVCRVCDLVMSRQCEKRTVCLCSGQYCWPTRIITTWPLENNSSNAPFILLLLLLLICGAFIKLDCILRDLLCWNIIDWTQCSFQCFQENVGMQILQHSQTSQNNRVFGKQQLLNCFIIGKEIWLNFLVTPFHHSDVSAKKREQFGQMGHRY